MSHPARTNSIAILGILVLLSAAVSAQDSAADPAATPAAAAPSVQHVYHCNVPARELAQVFQQVAGPGVTIVPEPINNVVIVRATEADLAQFNELVRELNRPARRIELSLTILEVDGRVEVPDVSPAQLLDTLSGEAAAARIRKIRLTSLENQQAQVQLGERRPVPSGASFSRGGERINTYQQEEFGTLLAMTARVGQENQVLVELSFEMSRLDESIGTTESAADEIPKGRRIVTLRTTVSVPDGETVLLTDFDSQDSPGDTRLFGFLTATTEQKAEQVTAAGSATRQALEAQRYFGILDKDDNGVLSSDEWLSSNRIRGMFQEDGLDLSQPMSVEQFVENYLRLSE